MILPSSRKRSTPRAPRRVDVGAAGPLGKLNGEEGSLVVEALIFVALILITALSLSQLLPIQLGFQRTLEDRARVEDHQDKAISLANVWLAPAELPLDSTGKTHVIYKAPDDPSAQSPTTLCYKLELASELVILYWKAASGDGPCADSSWSTSLTLAENVVNAVERPFLNYYETNDDSAPIADPEATDPGCNLPAPEAAPTATPGASGNPNGTYVYAVSFVRQDGETALGPESGSVTVANQQVDLSAVPTGPSDTTARRVYRSPAAASPRTWRLAVTVSNNTATTAQDNVSDAAISGNAEPSPAALAGGRCSASVLLQMDVDLPEDRVTLDTRRYRVLFANAATTAKLANNAVTAAKLDPGTFDPDRLADNGLGPDALAGGLAAGFEHLVLAAASDVNYGPPAAEVNLWRANTTSPAAGALKAGSEGHAALVVDWADYCRAGMRLEARGRYTVYNPQTTLNVGVRLLSFANSENGPRDGGSFAKVAPQSVSGGYQTLVSGWEVVDLGPCQPGNYLLADTPFLYLIQTKASAAQPFAVSNVLVELRFTPEVEPAGNNAPSAQPLSPYADLTVPSGPGSSLPLSGRFVDPDVSDRGLLRFELCADSSCSSVIDTGATRDSLANGALGRWTYSQPLAEGQDYYWRVRGEDTHGAVGAWSEIVVVHAD